MRRVIQRTLAILSVVAVLFMLPLPEVSAASSLSDMRNELAQLQKEAKEIENKLKGLGSSIADQQVEVAELYKKVANLEKQIDAYKTQIGAVNQDIADKDKKISELNGEISAKEELMKTIFTKLKKRVKAITQSTQFSSFQLLMNTEDYADYLLKTQVIHAVSAHDQALREQAENEKREIQTKKSEVETEKVALEDAKSELVALQSNLEKQFSALDSLYTTAKNKENALLKQQNSYEKKLQQIKASEDELDREIEEYLSKVPASETYGGKMFWPAPTIKRISSGYGKRGSGNHYAIDISNGRSLGEPIVAAANGTVLKVQKMHYSYGNFCMIDHGIDERGIRIVTLYAHMRYAPSVQVGQQVIGGVTQLGQIGNTGESYGAHLHFEVRENNKRVNPLNYVVQPR